MEQRSQEEQCVEGTKGALESKKAKRKSESGRKGVRNFLTKKEACGESRGQSPTRSKTTLEKDRWPPHTWKSSMSGRTEGGSWGPGMVPGQSRPGLDRTKKRRQKKGGARNTGLRKKRALKRARSAGWKATLQRRG